MVIHQLQVERRTGKVRRPETDVLQQYTTVPRNLRGGIRCERTFSRLVVR